MVLHYAYWVQAVKSFGGKPAAFSNLLFQMSPESGQYSYDKFFSALIGRIDKMNHFLMDLENIGLGNNFELKRKVDAIKGTLGNWNLQHDQSLKKDEMPDDTNVSTVMN